jgi:hypothetical protein
MAERVQKYAVFLWPLVSLSLSEPRLPGRSPLLYRHFLGQLALMSPVLGGLIQPLPDGMHTSLCREQAPIVFPSV